MTRNLLIRVEQPATASGVVTDSRFYLAPVCGAAWLAGIWLGSVSGLGITYRLTVALVALFAAMLLWRRGRLGLALAAVCALSLGAARYDSTRQAVGPDQVAYYNGARQVLITGEIVAEPQVSDTSRRLRVKAQTLQIDGATTPAEGDVLVQTGRFPEIGYGSTVRLTGDLQPPLALGSPGYAAYLERQGIHSVMSFPRIALLATDGGNPLRRALLAVKERGRDAIAQALPEPYAALLTGILLGDDSGMSRQLQDDFRATGMTHIIAISGFNIALIVVLLDRLSRPLLPRRAATLTIFVLISVYAVLVGAAASVVRATIMGIAYLVSLRLLGRPTLALAPLLCASLLMTLVQPQTLWDIGFQLSFAATLGLILFADSWTGWTESRLSQPTTAVLGRRAGRKAVRWIGEFFVVTLAAQALTLPLLLYHFGRLSPASLPANLLVLPVQPAVLVFGGAMLLAGLLHPAAARVVAWPVWLFLAYTVSVIRFLAEMPLASVPLTLSPPGLLALYAVIGAVGALTLMSVERRHSLGAQARGRIKPFTLLLAGILAIVLLIIALRSLPDGRLHVVYFDVGQGDAVFIQTPAGRQVLVDGGRYPSVLLEELGEHMPFWDRSIDLVVATHPDDDHIVGLTGVVERFGIGLLIASVGAGSDDPAYDSLLEDAAERGIPLHLAQAGERLDLGDGVSLEVLHPAADFRASSPNEGSVVLRLSYGDQTTLLTGDAEGEAEQAMLRSNRPLQSTVLKAGHHGANTSSSEAFLAAVKPQVIIISAGRDNSYGHPHPAMLRRASASGAAILRTDELGTVEMISDGRSMWWQSED